MREQASFVHACPACRVELDDRVRCAACGRAYEREGGIWRFLLEPQSHAAFLSQYGAVREAEGWGSSDARYYRALPHVHDGDPQRAIWRRREQHFRELLRIVPVAPQRILDAGAGNAWLAYQLTRRGHRVAALDISDDARDGLGAHVQYDATFECDQAEFARLPFADAQFDWVIFNAALHYARDLASALREAHRVLSPRGRIIVMDSPLYSDAASGAMMVRERERQLVRAYGVRELVRTPGYLTMSDLRQVCEAAGLHLARQSSAENWAGRVRRAWTWRRIRREPARFPLIVVGWG